MKYTATEWSVELPDSYTWMEMTQQAIGLKIDDEHVGSLGVSYSESSLWMCMANQLELLLFPLFGYSISRLKTRDRAGILITKKERDMVFYDAYIPDDKNCWQLSIVDYERALPINDIRQIADSFQTFRSN